MTLSVVILLLLAASDIWGSSFLLPRFAEYNPFL
jgi:hypothetical protein